MHACLYGLAHAVIVALGCAPGLGFVHVGHECSFVYDIADLYKAEVTIPIAFEVAAQAPEDLPAVVRRRVRDAMVEHHILERMVHDIRWLLLTEEEQLFPAYAGVIPGTRPGFWCSQTFPRIRGGDLKGKRRMVFLPGRLVTDRKTAADEKSGCTNSMEKVCARLHVVIYEILYYHKSASDLSFVRRGGTPKIRFFPVEFPTVHLMRIER